MTLESRSQTSLIRTNLHWLVPVQALTEEAGNLRVINRRDSMRWDPNNKNGNVHKSDENGRAPFQLEDCRSMFSDYRNSVDDNLHKQLDLEHPEEQNEEENWDTVRG